MSDSLYIVDPLTKQLAPVRPATFSVLGIQERKDLEVWVASHPEVLGEQLLIITSEFDRFDRSDRRLDLLALDKDGVLVVVELKLDLSRTFADQQAIRYAAFCSAMTMNEVLHAMSVFHGCTGEDAQQRILDFLEAETLPELGNQPRIILAGGSLDDQELTSTVLWLRSFGVDITCVELNPYRLPGNGELILAPRTIIPLPEARDYTVRVEQKQVAQTQKRQENTALRKLWDSITAQFNSLDLPFKATVRSTTSYLVVPINHSEMHYEWLPLKSKGVLRVALHFESDDRGTNEQRLNAVASHREMISKDVEFPFFAIMWGKQWATAEFRIPWDDTTPQESLVTDAVCTMRILIERTWPLIEPIATRIKE